MAKAKPRTQGASCHASHPDFQSGWEAWSCPICFKALTVNFRALDAHPACKRLHSDDQLSCVSCDFFSYGNSVARMVVLRKFSMCCRRCIGRGYVLGEGRKQRKQETT